MVGDGVNGAPSLAAAHAGITIGGEGTGLTMCAADAVLVRDDRATIAAILTIARRACRVAANLVIARTFIALHRMGAVSTLATANQAKRPRRLNRARRT